jgi:hypothetical protein
MLQDDDDDDDNNNNKNNNNKPVPTAERSEAHTAFGHSKTGIVG